MRAPDETLEEEAKKKWCPFRGTTKPYVAEDNCIGTACMMFILKHDYRVDSKGDWVAGPLADNELAIRQFNELKRVRYGHCGLVKQ